LDETFDEVLKAFEAFATKGKESTSMAEREREREREERETPKIQSPRVYAYLNRRLSELNMTRSDFIRLFHKQHGDAGSRNHLFKILNGQSIAGERGLLPLIVKTLDLDEEEAVRLVRTDKITAKDWASSVPKASKMAQEMVMVMDTLSKKDQADLLQFARMKAGMLFKV
jgi:hypothetical protein